MTPRTPVFIVTSPRPRVGKTLLSRALTEYFLAQQRPVAAFDVNPDSFSLVDRLPAYTAAASIADTRGEMALFDQLVVNDNVPKVVDLGHAMFDRFFAVMQDTGFEREARRRGVLPAVLYLPDPDERARQGYAMLTARFPDLPIVPVFNEAVPQIARCREHFPPAPRGGQPVTVPALTPVPRSVIERKGFTFLGYVSSITDTTSELYEWTKRVFVTFRDIEVRMLLGEIRPGLKRVG
ncbi:MAG: hypothetical protein FJX62_03935 [Alphaproteobacteria bacterium]|nr:hypothetical protein [Alphaproteobacteria bacterium]